MAECHTGLVRQGGGRAGRPAGLPDVPGRQFRPSDDFSDEQHGRSPGQLHSVCAHQLLLLYLHLCRRGGLSKAASDRRRQCHRDYGRGHRPVDRGLRGAGAGQWRQPNAGGLLHGGANRLLSKGRGALQHRQRCALPSSGADRIQAGRHASLRAQPNFQGLHLGHAAGPADAQTGGDQRGVLQFSPKVCDWPLQRRGADGQVEGHHVKLHLLHKRRRRGQANPGPVYPAEHEPVHRAAAHLCRPVCWGDWVDPGRPGLCDRQPIQRRGN